MRPGMGFGYRYFNLDSTMKITRTNLESDPEVTPARAQDILTRAANHAISSGKKMVRVSRLFTDDKCRQRRIIDEVGIYEHC